jgi:hypothetical protein
VAQVANGVQDEAYGDRLSCVPHSDYEQKIWGGNEEQQVAVHCHETREIEQAGKKDCGTNEIYEMYITASDIYQPIANGIERLNKNIKVEGTGCGEAPENRPVVVPVGANVVTQTEKNTHASISDQGDSAASDSPPTGQKYRPQRQAANKCQHGEIYDHGFSFPVEAIIDSSDRFNFSFFTTFSGFEP